MKILLVILIIAVIFMFYMFYQMSLKVGLIDEKEQGTDKEKVKKYQQQIEKEIIASIIALFMVFAISMIFYSNVRITGKQTTLNEEKYKQEIQMLKEKNKLDMEELKQDMIKKELDIYESIGKYGLGVNKKGEIVKIK